MEALAIAPDHHVVAIASGGCNILSYLTADPTKYHGARSQPVACCAGPSQAGGCGLSADMGLRFIASSATLMKLPISTPIVCICATDSIPRRAPIGIGAALWAWPAAHRYVFRQFYRHGLLGLLHRLRPCRLRGLHGIKPKTFLGARSARRAAQFFDAYLAPLFDKRLVRWVTRTPALALRSRNSAGAIRSAGGRAAMADVLSAQPVASAHLRFQLSTTIILPGRLSDAVMASVTAPLPPYLRAPISTRFADARSARRRQHARSPNICAVQATGPRPLCAARCAGLDDGRAAQRALERDHTHGAAGRTGYLPHRRGAKPSARTRAMRSPHAMASMKKRHRAHSRRAIALRSMAASTCIFTKATGKSHD